MNVNYKSDDNKNKIHWRIVKAVAQRCSVRKGVLRNFAKFTGKRLCQSFFFNKVSGLRPATSLKKRLWYRCFPVNYAKFLRTPFLTEHLRWLLLELLLPEISMFILQIQKIILVKETENLMMFTTNASN